jgi:pyruvate,water dikinase
MKNNELILQLSSTSKEDVLSCGGKGANLGELVKSGVPVPPGFVIPTSLYDRFLKENGLDTYEETVLNQCNLDDYSELNKASVLIEKAVLSGKISGRDESEIMKHFKKLNSKYVAVRSSATSEDMVESSWAGQLSTFLNSTKEELIVKIKKCWAYLYSTRAISYRISKDLLGLEVLVGVIVQKMVDAEVSGVAFTANPVTSDPDMIVIEAVLGLGEAVVSGMVTPDSYIVNKRDLTVFDCNIK